LADEAGLCGFAEMPQICELDEIIEGAKIHRAIILATE
jgi:hypothetical protein